MSFDEFCSIVRKKISADEEEREMRDMFRILDKEKRGEVNTDELRSAMSLYAFLSYFLVSLHFFLTLIFQHCITVCILVAA